MSVYEVDPLEDERWDDFVDRHPRGQVFHSRGWLRALRTTYRYRPFVISTSPPGAPLENAIALCEVDSWLTGRRLVSLPFSDHCDPLVDSNAEARELAEHLRALGAVGRYRYIELRPTVSLPEFSILSSGAAEECFHLHCLDLTPPLEQLFRNLHKSCVQRKIQRAERETLTYVAGRAERLLREFFQLMLRTRRRQNLPPQPFEWFKNLSECLGESLTVHVAYKEGRAIASILTLKYKDTVIYKYGCSDERFTALGGTPLLFWKTIEECRHAGYRQLDLGRTDLDNEGLIAFKDRLGARRQELRYQRISAGSRSNDPRKSWVVPLARKMASRMPDAALVISGKLMYRHMG